MTQEKLQFIVDEEGNQTAVIIDIDVFYAMLDSIEELEEHYFSHHPEERELRDAELEVMEEEEQ